MSDCEESCISVYRHLTHTPSVDSVISIKDDKVGDIIHWTATWSQRDIERNTKVSFHSTGIINRSDRKFTNLKNPGVTELNGEKIARASPCGKFKAVLREITVKDAKHHFLEIWEGSCKVSNTDLTDEDKHGMVHTSSTFGCMEWSHDGRRIAYVAEKKLVKTESYFKKFKSENGEKVVKGNEFEYREDWGEQLVGSHHPTLFVFDIKSGEISDLSEYLTNDISVGAALWSADDQDLFVLGWHMSPWKPGLVYCMNRLSTLYKLNLDSKKLTPLTSGQSCVFSPAINPDGTSLVYLETIPFGPHYQCSKMMCIDLDQSSEKEPRIVVDYMKQPADASSFQGLFVDGIPKQCWLASCHELVVHSIHRSNVALLCIDIKTGNIRIIERAGAWNLLSVIDDVLFVSKSTPNAPQVLKAGVFGTDNVTWIDVDSPFPALDDVKWSIQKYEPKLENAEYPGLEIESILIQPSGDQISKGLIVNPHGGPHSAYSAGFDLFSAAFCRLGYTVVRINYRGSLGFGQNGVFSLPKHISRQDVSDVQQVAEAVAEDLKFPQGKVFVHGGSHGGFLTLHLVGQFPDFYAAGATRNPVTNVASQISMTDIVDWCYCEAGLGFRYESTPSSDTYVKMLDCSPIKHVSKVKAPLLFMIGSVDLRVPPAQSHEYVHILQGLGKKFRLLKYDNNNHPIAGVDAEADCFVNMAKWFHENRKE